MKEKIINSTGVAVSKITAFFQINIMDVAGNEIYSSQDFGDNLLLSLTEQDLKIIERKVNLNILEKSL